MKVCVGQFYVEYGVETYQDTMLTQSDRMCMRTHLIYI